ncbi:molybdenum cofactor biosynthesis protein MoaE [Acetobacter sp. LMG 32666]|uniref:molybdenum cofactor biosynthesis protein MoaE n=1 Tax=Acetobacter sp. LMG 32666 TaxID=2959295 RepID=UPI0030C85785
MSVHVRVQAEPFDVGVETARLSVLSSHTGGVGVFVGQVRGGHGLLAMTLEHYPGMTEAALNTLAQEAIARFELTGCTLIHRIGRLQVGAGIVFVGAAAPHRGAALTATSFLIDRLKTGAPFWKREEYANGRTQWVDARETDEDAARAWLLKNP